MNENLSLGAPQLAAPILIAAGGNSDALLVQGMLGEEFEQVFTSTDQERAAADVDYYHPAVLVLAFDTMEKAERYYLGLYRLYPQLPQLPHRTVVLCHKDEVQRAYQLCRQGLFDDYVLFWPMTLDAPRLPMAIHHALRELAAHCQQRQALDMRMAEGRACTADTARAVVQAERYITAELDQLAGRLAAEHGHTDGDSKLLAGLWHELRQLKTRLLRPQFQEIAHTLQLVIEWQEALQGAHSRVPSGQQEIMMAEADKKTVLLVDDDAFQHKLIGQMLASEPYRLLFASSGDEALSLLRTTVPDLILMDLMLPGIDGIETLRQLKAMPALGNVPVIMLTGRAEGPVVRDSLKAGARGFVVKPFDRSTLLGKVQGLLATDSTQPT